MPIFHEDSENDPPSVDRQSYRRLDCSLLHFGPVMMYHNRGILEEDVATLMDEGYTVRRFDASSWESPDSFFRDFAATMEFQEGYGGNLNAMNDCLGYIPIQDVGGTVVVFEAFDQFASAHAEFAQTVLDVIACNSRLRQIFGKTLLVLVQSNDPRIRFEPVGGSSVYWNQREFLDSSRGL